ncbi:MAG: glycosyltransferase, partial [Pseudomonadota bacterium]
MKIIYLHQYFNTLNMSGGTRSFEIGKRMVEAGHEVHIVTTDTNSKNSKKLNWYKTNEEGINVHWFTNPYSNLMSYKRRMISFARFAIYSSLKAANLKGDLIFATSTPLTIAIPAIYSSWKNKIPMIFEVRDLWPAGPIKIKALKNPIAILLAKWLEKLAYFKSAHVIALSPEMKEGILETGYPESKVSIIPNS